MEYTNEELKRMPVQAIIPCKGCKFLKPTQFPEYHECAYQPPKVPTAYWQNPQPYEAPATWRNTKYLDGNGPFTDDARRIECDVFESKGGQP